MTVQNLSDFFIVTVKMLIIDAILWVLIKKMQLMLNSSVLGDKGVS